ncbi:MAG: phage major capsid protein [Vicinamibacterales bacterium]
MAEDNEQPTGPKLTHTQAVNRCRELHAELERLGGIDDPSAEEEARFAEATAEFDEADKWRKKLERDAARAKVQAVVEGDLRTATTRFGKPSIGGRLELGAGSDDNYDSDPVLNPDSVEDRRFRDPWNLGEVRTYGRPQGEVVAEMRSRALCAIEKMSGSTDRQRQAATKMIENWDDQDGRLSRFVLETSSPVYMRAWSKMAVNPVGADLTPEERASVERVQSYARAMSLTDNAGGYMVPFQLDPTVILTSDGSMNQIRSVARQVIATGDIWNGVSAGDVSWSYDAESAEVSDDAPTFAQPTVPIHLAEGFVPITRQAFQDAANVTQEVGRLLARGKDNLETAAFTTGSGSGQPTGIVTALVAASSPIVASASADTFALADVYALDSALPERYHGNDSSAWLAHRLIWNKIRQFDTAGGAGLFAENLRLGIPDALLDERRITSEGMDGTYGSGDNYVLILGDWENYVIADRVGMSVEFIPHLFGTSNGRPKNQHGWLAYARHGAAPVNTGAFRILNVT